MLLKPLKAVLLAAIAVLFIATSWMTDELYRPFRESGESAEFRIERGRGAGPIIRALEDSRIIRDPVALLAAYHFFYFDTSLKAGEYLIDFPIASKAVLFKVFEGVIVLHPFTIPEGLILPEVEDLFRKRAPSTKSSDTNPFEWIALIADLDPEAKDLEGYLFPDTYHLPEDATAGDLVRAMVDEFRATFREDWRARAAELGMSIREVVTLASLIEKETARTEEKALVSAVFHNRLRIGMKLDCDPTILYALKIEGRPAKRLLTRDLKHPSPYNTYLRPGLPPGPICSPGRSSLEAALFPAEAEFLYFVSRNDGSHAFSLTFREHQDAVRRYQLKKK